ncbi:zinc ribbon domain-containing protein [uncultured Oscillibacter sp.]|uniref:zinc ribbon domain-containing protein n=1 Tax=uncultured Oscillibacter sp. TaxID=876091 RepID=UPI0025D6E78E|nr:zinc ribbon domain-containing protein [uncultured Oscillibacter sp.]
MDEKLQEILDTVQKTAVEVGTAAGDLFSAAGQRASALLSVSKLNVRAADLKAQRSVLLQEVGAMVYGTHTGTVADSDTLLAKLREIDGVEQELSRVNAEIARLRQNARVCPLCGADARSGDAFCRNCGTRL